MDLYEAIERRRTTRVFEKPATEEQLRKIILAGTKAPSGLNTQPWEFVIVEDQSLIDRIADLKYKSHKGLEAVLFSILLKKRQ